MKQYKEVQNQKEITPSLLCFSLTVTLLTIVCTSLKENDAGLMMMIMAKHLLDAYSVLGTALSIIHVSM